MGRHPVIFFSSLLLPPSQTFIRAQGEELQRFCPYYAGSRLVPGLALPPDRTLVINRGGVEGTAAEALFKVTGFAPGFYQRLAALQPVLIHAQFGLSGALALPLARSLKLPLLVHFRGADATIPESVAKWSSLNHWIYFRRQQALQRQARLFLTVSAFIQTKLLEQGFPPEKVRVHYSGIDVTQFQPDPTVPRQPVVLFVGRLTEKKGCEYLIRAMAAVQKTLPEVQLIIIGDGSLKRDLEQLAAATLKSYQFLGFQPVAVVKSWMNRASLFVAPSVTAHQGDSEGLPNVVLEAQAMGLPVVSTVHAGIPEAIVQGETGFLAPERNSEALTQYILRLLQDPDLWQAFSHQGQARVRTHFDRRQQTRILEGIYKEILAAELS